MTPEIEKGLIDGKFSNNIKERMWIYSSAERARQPQAALRA